MSTQHPLEMRSILFEAHNLTVRQGTGIATYARGLAEAAGRLGLGADGLFGVERALVKGEDQLNEVLAFDAIDEDKALSLLEVVLRHIGYPFNALGGLHPIELSRQGVVLGPMNDLLAPFNRVFVATRLVEASINHFKIYGRFAQVRLPRRPQLFHATHPVPISVRGCPNLYTVHDLVPLRLPYTTLDDKKYFYRLLKSIARKADHIVTVSEHSRRDIIEYLGVDEKRVTNTYQSVHIPVRVLSRPVDEVAKILEVQFGLEFGNYFLFYGAIEPKKNLSRLVDAYVAARSNLPLVVAGGRGWQNKEEMRKLADARFVNIRFGDGLVKRERQVRRLEYLPRDQLMYLIRGARAVLFPSIYEGFGLPVVEAMMIGTAVVTSNVSSLPEIAGDAALSVDPYSVDDMARAISAVEADRDLRAHLVSSGRTQAKKFDTAAYDERIRDLYANW